MTPKAYYKKLKSFWLYKNLKKFPRGKSNISKTNIQFLSEYGLPKWAAPGFMFSDFDGVFFPRLREWSWRPKKTKYSDENAYVIGTAPDMTPRIQDGDPVCIKEKGTEVFICRRGKRKMEYLGKDVPVLAECLIVLAEMIEEVLKKNGENAYMEKRIPLNLILNSKNKMKKIDPKVLDAGSFWSRWFKFKIAEVKREKSDGKHRSS